MKGRPDRSAAPGTRVLAALALLATLAGCAVAPSPLEPDPVERPEPVERPDPVEPPEREPDGRPPEPRPAEEPLPPVQVEQLAEGEAVPLGVPVPDPALGPPVRGERVTLTAVGTEVRSLLAALAEAAGVNLVVGPAVQGRVTVHFEDVLAVEALEQVVRETGHMIARPLERPFLPPVYYVVPVNVNEADAATIQARFGVSAELAEFLVRSRVPPN